MTAARWGEYIMTVETVNILEWLQSRKRFGIHPGLERTRAVLGALGCPEHNLRFVHVAGTNGKGSVCAFLTSLFSIDHSVGTFTSPSFDGYRGRFVVNGEAMDDSTFAELAARVKAADEAVNGAEPLTEFEVLTVMAILYFSLRQVDVVVWETGMGGRYDSTNVVTPVVTGITNVSLDHMEILGDTVRKIAWEKAGICKPGVPMVTAASGQALDVIQRVAADTGSPLFVHGQQYAGISTGPSGWPPKLHYRGLMHDWHEISLGLHGLHQVENAAVALAMYELACGELGWRPAAISELRRAMAQTRWPGRLEWFRENGVDVILDGAHNAAGVVRMVQSLQQFSTVHGIPRDAWTMVIGVLNDKDARSMLQQALPLAARVIVTAPASPRASSPWQLATAVTEVRKDVAVQVIPTVAEAIQAAVAAGAR
ncbi:tetrahydrofolate synthase [Alicyclobacillus contaminans]|nr:tetrahydrofolate synthase [Alicyclobacillus contaminans]